VNFCQTYNTENCIVEDAEKIYFKLNAITQAPFSAYISWNEFKVMCGSPERYIQKKDTQLLSQPIKGTAPRNKDVKIDNALLEDLKNSKKERAENTMIVDLVRNDLARIAKKNSVEVSEFCGIHSFKTVHQMISTVRCELIENTTFTDCLKATFPMGSMTGAPKLRTMEIIEEMEDFKRGLYAGSIGLIKPNGDFDFNVVIRSLIYNEKSQAASLSVGSAITIQSDAKAEYEECLVKIERILEGINA
jgi:para-aminobenzoate synthetase component 1